MMDIKSICNWTSSDNGQMIVGASVLLLGAAHFGKASGITDFSLPIVGSVGNLAGGIGVVVGVCVLANRLM